MLRVNFRPKKCATIAAEENFLFNNVSDVTIRKRAFKRDNKNL